MFYVLGQIDSLNRLPILGPCTLSSIAALFLHNSIIVFYLCRRYFFLSIDFLFCRSLPRCPSASDERSTYVFLEIQLKPQTLPGTWIPSSFHC